MLLISGYARDWRERDARPTPGYRMPSQNEVLAAMVADEFRPAKFEDLQGRTFGRLTVLERVTGAYHLKRVTLGASWRCRCSCGAVVVKPGSVLLNGSVQSCGCLARDLRAARRSARGE